jgi:type I restriction enzyme S subunit
MSGVTVRPLGEVAALQAGVGFPLDLQGRSNGKYPLAKVGDISRGGRSGEAVLSSADHFVDEIDLERLRAKPIPAGSVLFAKIGEAIRQNHRVIAGCPLLIDNNAMAAIPGPEIESRYLYYFLRTVDFYRVASATTVPALRKSELERIGVPLFALPEQRRIAEVLDRAEALRAKRRAALAQLDTLTQSIFLDLFGDPDRGSNEWPSVMLGDVAEIITGYPFRSQEYQGPADGVRLCRGANVMPSRLDWSDLACWPAGRTDSMADFNLVPGDIVLAMDRPWISEGFKLAEVRASDCPALLVQRVARLRGKTGVSNAFLLHTLGQPAFARHCRPTETTIPHISPKEIRSFTFSFPPLALQQDFAHRIAAVDKLKSAHRASLAKLDALFASLQHRAFRGEL